MKRSSPVACCVLISPISTDVSKRSTEHIIAKPRQGSRAVARAFQCCSCRQSRGSDDVQNPRTPSDIDTPAVAFFACSIRKAFPAYRRNHAAVRSLGNLADDGQRGWCIAMYGSSVL